MKGRRASATTPAPTGTKRTSAARVLGEDGATLLDLVDNALSKGVVLTGDITLALAHVDLVYVRLSLLLCAADRVMPGEPPDLLERRHFRKTRMRRVTHRE